MPLVHESKKQPTDAPKPAKNPNTGGWFEQFRRLLLLLMKLKAWRLIVIIVPIALLVSNTILLPLITNQMKRSDSHSQINGSDHLVFYSGSDFTASKGKVLVDRNAFPDEAAAATSIMTAEDGTSDWIEECASETDCRERYLHRTDDAIVALIRYSKTPEKSRAVLECIRDDERNADMRCAFLYKVMVLSMQKSLGVATFKDVQLFELLDKYSSKATTTERYDIEKKKSLPPSLCADWIKTDAFTQLTSVSVPVSISYAAFGVNFYLLISTISCIRMLKTDGFLQQLFRSGLSVSAYWLVIWLITVVECLVFAGVYTASNAYICNGVFPASTMARIFVFFSLFCLNLAVFMLLLELLLPPMLLVSILSFVMSVGLLIANFITPPLKEKAPYLLYIFSPFFCAEYIKELFNWEVERQFSANELQENEPERLSQILTWTVIGLLLLFLLLTYLDFILSSGNGLCLSPTYPLMPGFWSQQAKKDQGEAAPGKSQAEKSESHIEPVMGLPPIVVVEDVTKAYWNYFFCCPDGPVVLKRLSCKIYRGQITALIGHNGAGKSTLIKILTGEELPDEGTAHIGGCLVTNPLLRLALRGRISICPQFDALCDSLTVLECIRVTLVSRAVSDTSQLERARGMLRRLGLGDKEDVLSCNLSGGQRRKVSTILALLGDPDVVFLDEPTSGLDPVSRRQLWQLLQEEKRARSIILCTQFMDEADILADRKIFLCGGKIVCAGSSMFLKRAFGCSFTVNVSLKSKAGAQSLLAKLKQVRVKCHDETELQLEVPALNSAVLTEAVQVLETSGEVETFGLSQASLDDVFMRLSGMDVEDVIKAFRAGTLMLPQQSEIANLFLETPETKESSEPSLRNSNKMRTSVIVQFIALFYVNIKRQVRVRSNLLSRFLVPAALLATMAACTALFKIEVKETLSDPESSQMDILNKPQKLRVDYYGREAIPIACVTDGDTNPLSMENCESLSLPDTTEQGTARPPILIQKSPSESMKDFMSQKSTRDKLYNKLKSNQWIKEKGFMTPCVVYHAVPWQKNVSKKDRSISVGIFYGEYNFLSKVHIHRRALVRMLKFFGVARPETTTALAVTKDTNISRTSIDTGLQLVVFYFIFSLFPVSYLSDPIEDMSSRVRSYLVSTGMTHLAYWINTFAMHWVQYVICYTIAVGLIMISEIYRCAYLILAAFVPVFVLGIVSNLLTIYTIAVLTRTKSTLVSTGCVLGAVFLPTAVLLVRNSSSHLKLLIWMVPPAAPLFLVYSCASYYFLKLEYYQTNYGSELPNMTQSLWNNPGIFHSLLAMPVHIIVLCSIICAVEKSAAIREAVCHRGAQTKRPDKTDSDMEEGARKEAERVLSTPRNFKNVLEVRQLQKIHSNGVHAVRGITFGAMAGEIFGLLGVNGAGKSSSMSMIVGEEAATEGVCEVCVQDGGWVSGREGATIGAIGYCPQHNPLFDSITVSEHIRFYADIRGLDSIEAERQTTRLIRSLGLVQHCDKQAGQLSGGNKRRLCLAIALLGDPALIVIDEASTGVDPENKRFIWGAIRRMTRKQRSVMVTTHSMEEVEVLCSRVGIMNKGRMISVGTVQQLRSRHGDAYTLELLLVPLGEFAIRQKKLLIKKVVSDQFKGVQSQEDLGLGLVMQFSVPKPAVRRLSDALKWLAANQSRLGVSYWALYQMSLDQVFVKLIKMYDRSAQKPAAKSINST